MLTASTGCLLVITLILAIAGFLAIAHGMRETCRLTVRRYNISLNGLAAPVRLAHLSDTHGSATFGRLNLRHRLSQLEPDLIAFTGDLADHQSDIERAVSEIGNLTSVAPVFFVPGNHDLHVSANRGDRRILEQMSASAGVTVMTNSGVPFEIRGANLYLGGVDDYEKGQPEIFAASAGCRVAGPPKVLLSHSPDIVLRIKPGDWDLILSGHTHGGQVRLPLIGPVVVNSATGRLFWRGPARYRGAMVVVSQGLGTASLPVRFLCPPEIIILDLEPLALPLERARRME